MIHTKPKIRRYFIGKVIGWGWGFWPPYSDTNDFPLYQALTIRGLSYAFTRSNNVS